MSRKQNLKIMASTPQRELDEAIAAEAAVIKRFNTAEEEFNRRFPGDHRLFSLMASYEPERIAFYDDQAIVLGLRNDVMTASHAVRQARVRVAQSGADNEKRAALAAAIKAAAKAAETLDGANAAVDRASGMVATAQAKFDGATRSANEAREQHSRNAEDAARSGQPIVAVSLREARSNETDALDELNAAKSALAKMREPIAALKAAREHADENVARLADDVVMTASVSALLKQARDRWRKLVEVRLVLRYLDEAGLVLDSERDEVKDFLLDRALPGRHGDVELQEWDEDEATLEWRQVREALRRDPDAPLPKIEVADDIR